MRKDKEVLKKVVHKENIQEEKKIIWMKNEPEDDS